LTSGSYFVPASPGDDVAITRHWRVRRVDNTFTTPRTWTTGTATDSRTSVAVVPSVTMIVPTQGPTTGGTLVTITGLGFSGIDDLNPSSVKFGTLDATSFVVNSNTQITAVAPPVASVQTVHITITTAAGTSATSAADLFEYTNASAAPTFNQFTVNGGDMWTVDAFGESPTDLLGNNSIVEQLYVTFDIGVTLAPGAFRLDAGTVTQNISNLVTSGCGRHRCGRNHRRSGH